MGELVRLSVLLAAITLLKLCFSCAASTRREFEKGNPSVDLRCFFPQSHTIMRNVIREALEVVS